MSENEVDYERYNEDPRAVCKYGTKCYQKNPAHQEKYKHPPKRKNNGAANPPRKKLKVETSNKDIKEVVTRCDVSDSDYSIDDSSDNSDIKTKTVDSNKTVSDDDKKQQNKDIILTLVLLPVAKKKLKRILKNLILNHELRKKHPPLF
ncbi:hypothetical protein NQ318_012608 [Aromia moschata]|uniref:PBZ-type domain-containing protein n=1 Tax=Aromia moschata TaxID=1265417 RepID=A0AAV8YLN6_9CUCU|nr:hypothetical protein NQ318_012608 [Aromia moschata]